MKKSLLYLILALVMVGCEDKKEVEDLKTQQTNCLILTSPGLNSDVTPFQPTFTWNGCNSINYRFTLSTANNLSKPLFDTVLTTNSFQVPGVFKNNNKFLKALEENKTYYWRVIQDSDTATSSFKTKPYLDIFGFHPVKVLYTKKLYDPNPPNTPYFVDTTYTGNVEIRAVSNNKIYVAETVGKISNTINFLSASPDLVEYFSANDGSGFKYVNFYYYPKTKNLSIRFYDGGLGSCTNCWYLTTTIE